MSASMPYSFTVPMGTPSRQLDPVRAAALHEAVAMLPNLTINSAAYKIDVKVPVELVIANAKKLEAYLAGEEAS